MMIDGRPIGPEHPPYVIAEISNNHLADPERACRLIEIAAQAGADAVKIQTYDADSLTIDCDRPEFMIRTAPWEGLNYYQLYKKIALSASFTERLFRAAKEARALLWRAAIVRIVEHIALIAALDGKVQIAARLLGYGVAFYAEGTATREFTEMSTYNRLTAELAKALPEEEVTRLTGEGALWSEDRAIEAASST